MKKYFSSLILILLLLTIGCSASDHAADKNILIGEWHDTTGSNIIIIFKQNSQCEIIFKDRNKTTKSKGSYSVDFSKSPIPLSMTNLTKIGHPIHTIIKFHDENTIEMGRFSPKWRLRPIVIEKDYALVLKRM